MKNGETIVKKMIRPYDVKEAVILRDALTLFLMTLQAQKDLYKDQKLYDQTLKAVNSLRIKYHKIAMIQMRMNEKGELEFRDAN